LELEIVETRAKNVEAAFAYTPWPYWKNYHSYALVGYVKRIQFLAARGEMI
jgi:hypothetical protein